MLGKIKAILLYAGFDRAGIGRIIHKVRRANRIMVSVLSLVATGLIGAMLISSYYLPGTRNGRVVYLVGTILSLIVFFSSFIVKKYERLTDSLVHVACSVYYIYGILLAIVAEPEGKTVTFIVMLVLMPILFIERPVKTVALVVFYDAIFIYLCLQYKTGSVQAIDIIDGVLFGILGIASGVVINQMKVRGYIDAQKLQEISRVDLLTGVSNRNAYELDLFSISEKCRYNLACIYIDVNGLHEINNTEGHESGDKMLKFVAEQIKETFKDGSVYRIGGDEFVVFMPDMQIADLGYDVKKLARKVEAKGYYIAIGYEIMGIRYLVIDELIKAAETRMSVNKDAYYEDVENRDARRKNQL